MIVGLDNSYTMKGSAASCDTSSANQSTPLNPPAKKKRNLPGTPDPDAEVIALSPETLLATNRFVCEICQKGFQRDQNLQLHRRGHNLPWNLKQRSSTDVKKRVYICPEPHCVHHDPSRALGDLTGIKKHFCRKHGVKKWKCDKCLKQYAVQSDWKAHSKICGTKEYRCDCGTLFSRRESFVTHRALCDALSEEKSKTQAATESPSNYEDILNDSVPSSLSLLLPPTVSAPPPEALLPAVPDSTDAVSYIMPDAESVEVTNSDPNLTESQILEVMPTMTSLTASCISSFSSNGSSNSNVFPTMFASSTSSGSIPSRTTGFTSLFQPIARPDQSSDVSPSASSEPIALRLGVNQGPSIFLSHGQDFPHYAPAPQPALSATALLQKAAQMGATSSNGSLLRALGIVSSISSANTTEEWSQQQIESNTESLAAGLGLGLACNSRSSLNELMLGGTCVFGPKQTTLDFLGLGMGASGGSTSGLSAFMTSITRSLDVALAEQPFGGQE